MGKFRFCFFCVLLICCSCKQRYDFLYYQDQKVNLYSLPGMVRNETEVTSDTSRSGNSVVYLYWAGRMQWQEEKKDGPFFFPSATGTYTLYAFSNPMHPLWTPVYMEKSFSSSPVRDLMQSEETGILPPGSGVYIPQLNKGSLLRRVNNY